MTPPKPQEVTGREWKHKEFGYSLRVMAFADGYVMVRRKGCIPFVLFFKTLQRDYERIEG